MRGSKLLEIKPPTRKMLGWTLFAVGLILLIIAVIWVLPLFPAQARIVEFLIGCILVPISIFFFLISVIAILHFIFSKSKPPDEPGEEEQ